MNTWNGKDITALSDDELWAAIQSVAEVDNFRFDKLSDPRIKKKNHRLNKIFSANPPTENENFKILIHNLNVEWNKRNADK